MKRANDWRAEMARLPESGMGYHRVDVTLASGVEVAGVVIVNGDEVRWPEGCEGTRTDDIVAVRAQRA